MDGCLLQKVLQLTETQTFNIWTYSFPKVWSLSELPIFSGVTHKMMPAAEFLVWTYFIDFIF